MVLVACLIALLVLFGMAKWTSVLFSDIRNKLGDQVVFSNWKGRPYCRAYVKPANPNTLPQQAQRDKNRKGILGYQTEVAGIPAAITAWNELALTRQISGANLFQKYALSVSILAEANLPGPNDNQITYTIQHDLALMGLYVSVDGAAVTELVAPGGLTGGDNQTYDHLGATDPGSSQYFIGPGSMFADMAGADKDAVKCATWFANGATGVAVPAVAVQP